MPQVGSARVRRHGIKEGTNDMDYVDVNARTIDKWVLDGWKWGIPITSEDFARAKKGDWQVLLTPTRPVPTNWFAPYLMGGSFGGTRLLGLASGGGQQVPIFSALGAICTVLDYSDKQLESEKIVADREGYHIEIVKADMTKRFPFDDGAFDIIFHPVSNCYVENVRHLWRECSRVLKPGGILLAGMDYGLNYLVEDNNPRLIINKLPFNPLTDEALYRRSVEAGSGIQFSHTIEEQVGGQLEAGLELTNLYEDTDDEGIGCFIPNYIATRSVRK